MNLQLITVEVSSKPKITIEVSSKPILNSLTLMPTYLKWVMNFQIKPEIQLKISSSFLIFLLLSKDIIIIILLLLNRNTIQIFMFVNKAFFIKILGSWNNHYQDNLRFVPSFFSQRINSFLGATCWICTAGIMECG